MRILTLLLSIYISIKTVSYGIFEWKQQQNKFGASCIFVFATVSLIVPIVMVTIRI